MPVIRVSDEVYKAIWERGKELGILFPSANDVLGADYVDGRRLEATPGDVTTEKHELNAPAKTNESPGGSSIRIPLRTIHYAREYALIPVPKTDRRFLPGYKVSFELETDVGSITTRVTSAPRGAHNGDPEAGAYIQGNLRDWYNAHKELSNGAILQIDAVEPGKRYRLSVVRSGQR